MRLKTSLYDHQIQAVKKLLQYKIGALYMEMGTGKTRTALELIQCRLDAGKVDCAIWLYPTTENVKMSLITDFNKHADGWEDVITLCGIETLSTSYRENLRLLTLAQKERCFLVVDESLLVKNPYAMRSMHITRLAEFCPYRIILNGTPISRNEADLFAQWYLLDWRILGYKSYWSFAANHLEYDKVYKKKIRRVLNIDYLTDKIAPYTFQITKDQVLKLPEKQYITYYFDMTDEQAKEYYRVKEDFLSLDLLYSEYDTTIIYRTFNALQQVSSGRFIASLAKEPIRHCPMFDILQDNPRIDMLLYIVDNVVPKKEKAVIWCKFKHEIEDVAAVLQEHGETTALCYGKCSKRQRREAVQQFQKNSRILIANKSCAAFSSNFQFAHYAIFYNNDWDWATRQQAEDRMHRIGQEHTVIIIDICARSTIDIRIQNCMFRKENMADGFKSHLDKKSLAAWLDGKDGLSDDTNRIDRRTKKE